MSHNLGRVVADGRTFNETAGLDLIPSVGPLGGPRFVMLRKKGGQATFPSRAGEGVALSATRVCEMVHMVELEPSEYSGREGAATLLQRATADQYRT